VVNIGRGIAKDLIFEPWIVGDEVVEIKSRPVMSPGGYSEIGCIEIGDVLNSSRLKNYIDKELSNGAKYGIVVTYSDLRKRHYKATFIPDEGYNDRFRIVDHKSRD